jgi:Fe-S cluster assembly ATP-binding protein
MELLRIKNLFYTVNDRHIIKNLNLSIYPQEIHALLGANGSGKTTLAINDLPVHERARLGITMAWQEPVRFEGICVADYLTLKSRFVSSKSLQPSLSPAHYLEMVGLEPSLYLDRMVDRSLSGGERKRIELASLLALNPRLAILDEPDSGIDMLSTQDIINVINAFKENGSAVLLITHREEIALIADRASQICHGEIIISGTPEEVSGYYKSKRCLVCDGEVCHPEG